jgi:hypothetical protein
MLQSAKWMEILSGARGASCTDCGFEPVSAETQTGLWTAPDPNFGYWKIVEQRLAAGFAAFGANLPKFRARDRVLHS